MDLPVDAEVLVTRDASGRHYVLGRIAKASELGPSREVTIRGARVRIEGTEEVELRSSRTRLQLKAGGDFYVLAERVVSKARRLDKPVAPKIKLN